jgi:hypothetical protein
MSLPRSVAEVLNSHMTLEVESIDRMYPDMYQPRFQTDRGMAAVFRLHREEIFACSALMNPMRKSFITAVDRFLRREKIPLIAFTKGQRKDDVTQEYRSRFSKSEGVVVVRTAQEKKLVFRTEKRRNPQTGRTNPWIVRATAMGNQYYFYGIDENFGPFFLKFCTYFPYNAKLCINGHEYVKRQLAKEKIEFEALDNGILKCANLRHLQQFCDRLSAVKIDALLQKGLARLPHALSSKNRATGYRYDVSILQAEFSLTQVLNQLRTGRIFFEEVIREILDIGRPDYVQLIFGRRINTCTPGRFRNRVITEGVTPSLHVDYKRSRIKQYHKEGRVLRTETTINDPRDFGIGKRLSNLPALRRIGFQANRRLVDVQRISQDCAVGEDAFYDVDEPIEVDEQHASGLPFADAAVQALLNALLVFGLLSRGFSSRDLRDHWAPLLGKSSDDRTPSQMTDRRRRLRLYGLIKRLAGIHRYQVTKQG